MLWWILLIKEYRPDIQYITGAKNILVDAIYRLPLNGKPKFTHESNYNVVTLLEMYDAEEVPNGMCTLKFKTIGHFKQ